MQLSSRSKLRKEACALWQVLFSFARCPAFGQLGIVEQIKSVPAKRQCLKQSLQRLQLASHTTDLTTMCAKTPVSYYSAMDFISTVIDRLLLSMFIDYSSNLYDAVVLQRIGKIWQMSETQLQAGAGSV